VELVAGTREAAQAQPLEAMVGLQVCASRRVCADRVT
jgi:hypothetical protein